MKNDYTVGGAREVAINSTGGRSNIGFLNQVVENYRSTSVVAGPITNVDKKIVGLAVGAAITKRTGGYSVGQYIFNGVAPHLSTHTQTISLVARTVVMNGVLVTGAYEFGNGVGSIVRSSVNQALRIGD